MRKTEFLTTACDPKTLTVGQMMQDAVFTCGSRADALAISRMMTLRNFGSLPVVEEDRTLVGGGLVPAFHSGPTVLPGKNGVKAAYITMAHSSS